MRRLFAAIVLAGFAFTACMGPSKVAQGQRYTAHDPRYDPYFGDIHEAQVDAGKWPEEQNAAKKPIAEALDLPVTASYSTIVSAAKDKKRRSTNLRPAIESTVQAHRALAKKLRARAERLDELAKRGDELEERASADRANMGADKADEEKVKHKEEIKHELSAAQSAARSLARQAKNAARDAEGFVADLEGVYGGKVPEARAASTKPPEAPKPAEPPKKAAASKKPDPPPAKPPPAPAKAPKPNPAPPPAQKGTDEVFDP